MALEKMRKEKDPGMRRKSLKALQSFSVASVLMRLIACHTLSVSGQTGTRALSLRSYMKRQQLHSLVLVFILWCSLLPVCPAAEELFLEQQHYLPCWREWQCHVTAFRLLLFYQGV